MNKIVGSLGMVLVLLLGACGQSPSNTQGEESTLDSLGHSTPQYDYGNDAAGHGSSNTIYVVGDSEGKITQGSATSGPYIVKYDANKKILWRNQFANVHTATAKKVVVNSSGEAYMLGEATASLTGGTYPFVYRSIFLRKYSSTGTVLWTKQLGNTTSSLNDAADLVLTSSGDALVFGSDLASDMALYKVSSGGVVSTLYTHVKAQNYFIPRALAVDSSGNFYLLTDTFYPGSSQFGSFYIHKISSTGSYLGQGYAGLGAGEEFGDDLQVSGSDIFVTTHKNSSDPSAGTYLQKFPTTLTHYTTATSLKKIADTTAGFIPATLKMVGNNIYITGTVFGALSGQTNKGAYDVGVVSYDTALKHRWSKQFGGSQYDYGHGIATLANQNAIFVVGTTGSNLAGTTTFNGNTDAFTSKILMSTGAVQWIDQ